VSVTIEWPPPAPSFEPHESSPPPPPAPRRRRGGPLVEPLAARILAAAALGTFAAVHWGMLVEPNAGWQVVLGVAAGIAAGVVLEAARPLPRSARAGIGVAALAVTIAVALVAAGIPLRFLAPAGWGELIDGIGQALSSLPGVRVPFSGVDEWIRWTILAGGTTLAAIGCFIAVSGPRVVAAVPLVVLFAVPAVERTLPGQFARGAAFALLLLAFLALDRLPARAASGAATFALVAVLAGLGTAALVDRDHAPIDYEAIAQSLQHRSDPRFDWQHSYGPMSWTRDGREVLRVRARRAAYWKAENLDGFDGLRWGQARVFARSGVDAEVPDGAFRPEWEQTIRVRITGMRTENIIGAGTTLGVLRSPRPALPGASPGTFTVGRELGRGDAYIARVHVPDPSAAELASAGTDFPGTMSAYTSLSLPIGGAPAGLRSEVTYPFFGSGSEVQPLTIDATGFASRAGGELTKSGPYRQAYALARRLKAQSTTPYSYVRRVEDYFSRGFSYTESPPVRAVPLEAFLFRDRTGYCQQFSGAMALLLRMGGVPARVSTGFAPGTLDKSRGEYVVTDLDAHSWVEAWFPKYGWIPFDPTPADTPASSTVQAPSAPSAAAAGDIADKGSGPAPRAKATGGGGGGWQPWMFVLLLVPLAAVAAAGALAVRRRVAGPPAYEGADPLVDELERALRRSGRPVPAGTTLSDLERRFDGSQASAYIRALREGRYGWEDRPPTPSERRALRRELGEGLGLAGRLRALWALPPRAVRRRV
jgi:hypothetical protein